MSFTDRGEAFFGKLFGDLFMLEYINRTMSIKHMKIMNGLKCLYQKLFKSS